MKELLLNIIDLIAYFYLLVVVFLPNLLANGFLEAVKIVTLEDPLSMASLVIITYFVCLKLLDGFKFSNVYYLIGRLMLILGFFIIGYSKISIGGYTFSAPLLKPMLYPYDMEFTTEYLRDIVILQIFIFIILLLFRDMIEDFGLAVTLQIFLGGLIPTFQPLLSIHPDGVVDFPFIALWLFQNCIMCIIYGILFSPILFILAICTDFFD